ncbi:MAG: hypothetical protein Q9170_003073, partial [Blastenia crenularia]
MSPLGGMPAPGGARSPIPDTPQPINMDYGKSYGELTVSSKSSRRHRQRSRRRDKCRANPATIFASRQAGPLTGTPIHSPNSAQRIKHTSNRLGSHHQSRPGAFKAVEIPGVPASKSIMESHRQRSPPSKHGDRRQQPVRQVKLIQSIEHQVNLNDPDPASYSWDEPLMFDVKTDRYRRRSMSRNLFGSKSSPAHESDTSYLPEHTAPPSDTEASPLFKKSKPQRKRQPVVNQDDTVISYVDQADVVGSHARSPTIASVKRELTAAIDVASHHLMRSRQPFSESGDILPGSSSEFLTAENGALRRHLARLENLLLESQQIAEINNRDRERWYQRTMEIIGRVLPTGSAMLEGTGYGNQIEENMASARIAGNAISTRAFNVHGHNGAISYQPPRQPQPTIQQYSTHTLSAAQPSPPVGRVVDPHSQLAHSSQADMPQPNKLLRRESRADNVGEASTSSSARPEDIGSHSDNSPRRMAQSVERNLPQGFTTLPERSQSAKRSTSRCNGEEARDDPARAISTHAAGTGRMSSARIDDTVEEPEPKRAMKKVTNQAKESNQFQEGQNANMMGHRDHAFAQDMLSSGQNPVKGDWNTVTRGRIDRIGPENNGQSNIVRPTSESSRDREFSRETSELPDPDVLLQQFRESQRAQPFGPNGLNPTTKVQGANSASTSDSSVRRTKQPHTVKPVELPKDRFARGSEEPVLQRPHHEGLAARTRDSAAERARESGTVQVSSSMEKDPKSISGPSVQTSLPSLFDITLRPKGPILATQKPARGAHYAWRTDNPQIATIQRWIQLCQCPDLPEYFTDPAHARPRLSTWPHSKEQFLEHCKRIINCPGHLHITRQTCRSICEAECPVYMAELRQGGRHLEQGNESSRPIAGNGYDKDVEETLAFADAFLAGESNQDSHNRELDGNQYHEHGTIPSHVWYKKDQPRPQSRPPRPSSLQSELFLTPEDHTPTRHKTHAASKPPATPINNEYKSQIRTGKAVTLSTDRKKKRAGKLARRRARRLRTPISFPSPTQARISQAVQGPSGTFASVESPEAHNSLRTPTSTNPKKRAASTEPSLDSIEQRKKTRDLTLAQKEVSSEAVKGESKVKRTCSPTHHTDHKAKQQAGSKRAGIDGYPLPSSSVQDGSQVGGDGVADGRPSKVKSKGTKFQPGGSMHSDPAPILASEHISSNRAKLNSDVTAQRPSYKYLPGIFPMIARGEEPQLLPTTTKAVPKKSSSSTVDPRPAKAQESRGLNSSHPLGHHKGDYNRSKEPAHGLAIPKSREETIHDRHDTGPPYSPPVSPATAVKRAIAKHPRLPVVATDQATQSEQHEPKSRTASNDVSIGTRPSSKDTAARRSRLTKPSIEEQQASKPKLKRYVPHNKRTTNEELITIGRYNLSYDRHISAPYAFTWYGKLYTEYHYLLNEADAHGRRWDDREKKRLISR